ncbi:PLP-dependent transferase [Backusella circina FSU 941]|nr:PLP-dependent transferase [Backusella circina FSU 941]
MKINFLNGQPSNDILPTDLFLKAAQQTFSQPDAAATVLQYGHEYGPLDFIHRLSLFLTKEYKSTVSEKNLLITPGASLSLQHCLSILTRPGTRTKRVFFQDPTYFLVFDMFLNVGYTRDQFIAIPDTETGLDVDVLETHLTTEQGAVHDDIYDSVLYCVPSHANPTGSILSDEKRARLVALAKKHNMLIICDDVYDILTYQGDVPKRMVAYDNAGGPPVVISNCSFSKLLAPGARVGWIETDPLLVKRLGGW